MNMDNGFVRVALQIGALILLIGGVIGLFLPFLQGIVMIVLGIYLLSITSPSFKICMDRFLVRYPRAKAHVDRQHVRMSKFFKRKNHHDSH
jgi:uncharacterized membrane protein YbaN (DUF454 family)